MDKDKLTIKQAAEALGCSHQTIRRRIAAGEIPAKKEMTEFGPVWFIPISYIQAATTTTDVIEVTRQVSVSELAEVIRAQITNEIREEIKAGQERIEKLLVDRDEKLMAAIRSIQTHQKKKWPWSR